jgi:hypothetical protein
VRSLKYPLTIERTVIEEYIQEYTKYGIFLDEMMLRQLKIYGINVKD